MRKRIVIIDGNSLINRAYYAMKRPMITREGIYTQGIYGFINMLTKIKDDYTPDYLTVAWDRKAPTFRHQEYSQYKAGRKKMPPELAMEIPIMKEILSAMKIENLEIDGFEADDIIGTVARVAEEADLAPLIITGDKDALQLATDVTQVLITKRGISEFDLYDRDRMIETYHLTPEQFIDLKGLMGDTSDNIPGIPGIGEKTGIRLLTQFGSVEALLAGTDQIASKNLRNKVEEHAQLAVMSRRLAEINRYVPIEVDLERMVVEEPDYDKLITLYSKLEFNSFLKKIHLERPRVQTQAPSEDEIRVHEICTDRDFSVLEQLQNGAEISIRVFGDNSHISCPVLYGVAILDNKNYYYVNLEPAGLSGLLSDLFARKKPRFAGHDLVRDYYGLMRADIYVPDIAFDTAVAQYLIDPTRSGYELKTLVFESLHYELPDEDEYLEACGQMDLLGNSSHAYVQYGLKWCLAVRQLMTVQKEVLAQNNLIRIFEEVELPLVEVLAAMEAEGVSVNRDTLERFGADISEEMARIEAQIYALAGETFNINSPIQLGKILFEKLELPVVKKTKRGYSTSADVLEKIRKLHPIVDLVLQYRTLSKLNSTYVEGLKPLIGPDGKIRAHFRQTVTATGRISCTEPNLQNIPIRQELGRKLRCAFVPGSSEFTFVGADYSQIELRILAHLSGDENLIEAFNNGADIHRNTAARVFNLDYDQVTPLDRSRAKAVNFGVIYGMSGFGLSENLHITRKEAESYISDYFDKHAAVKAYMDGQIEVCRKRGYSETIMGRRRYIPEISSTSYTTRQLGERLAMNSPIQGSAADIIKLAMIRVYRELKERNMTSRLILQVHDELIICTAKEELAEVRELLVRNMEQAMDLKVRLESDLNQGNTWYELK